MAELWQPDEYAPAQLDDLAEQLRDYIRPGEPGDRFRELTYATVRRCRTCLTDVPAGEACDGCGHVPTEARRAA